MQLEVFNVEGSELERFSTRGHYRVKLDSFTLDLYFSPSESKKCVVFSPGFLDLKKYQYPYFQRINWLNEFDAVGISLADPTLSLSRDIGIGWFIGDRKRHFLRETAEFLDILISHLEIKRSSTLFFGSSAGGFSSLGLATILRGTKAFAVNPQTNVLKFHSITELYRTFTACFGTANSTIGIKSAYSERVDLIELIMREDYIPQFLIWQNTFDSYHYKDHLIPFLSNLPGSGFSSSGHVALAAHEDLGHNPPGLSALRKYFEDFFAEM
ncbi:hypothetical protein [Jannaschia formosa]|uniref:hypothetical protein n=1 Tax=Jannaschia formosa TaxID=2259592 RepID=UPI00107552F6|nr:hypothetical protein [Jannaschia formosa]TFL15973.1 hypothetical protein DR046_22515 [Jannaschia formosa]